MPRGIPNKKKNEPVMADPLVAEPPLEAEEMVREADLVLVRASERGYFGHAIRNAGEVFQMPTSAMRRWPLEVGEKERSGSDPVIVTTTFGMFELPSWVNLEKRDRVRDEELVPHGHKTAHGIQNGDVL